MADVIHTEEEVAAAVSARAGEITEKLGETNPLLLVVMSGGVPFAGHLMTQLHFPLEFDYLHVTRYGQKPPAARFPWRAAPVDAGQGAHGHHPDDILDEGSDARGHRRAHEGTRRAACYTAVATDKLNGKNKPLKADFVALTVPDRFVFGYGMDARRLPQSSAPSTP